jgi:hypothetical protein
MQVKFVISVQTIRRMKRWSIILFILFRCTNILVFGQNTIFLEGVPWLGGFILQLFFNNRHLSLGLQLYLTQLRRLAFVRCQDTHEVVSLNGYSLGSEIIIRLFRFITSKHLLPYYVKQPSLLVMRLLILSHHLTMPVLRLIVAVHVGTLT